MIISLLMILQLRRTWRGHLISIHVTISGSSSSGTGSSPPQMVHPRSWPVSLAIQWVLSGGCRSGCPSLHMASPGGSVGLHRSLVPWGSIWDHTQQESKLSSPVQAFTKPPFCSMLANVPLAKASHVATPGFGKEQEHECLGGMALWESHTRWNSKILWSCACVFLCITDLFHFLSETLRCQTFFL